MSHERTSVGIGRPSEIEAALAHLERNYDSLNSVVVEQGRMLARLQKRIEQLNDDFKMRDLEPPPAHNVKPPHYSG